MSVAHDLGQRRILIERSTLPTLPPHWKLTRVGSVFEERNERVSDTDYEPLSVTMRGIVPRLDTAAKSDAGDNRKKVLPGDLVINSRSDRRGSSGVSALRGSVSLICTVLKPRGILPEFAHHLIRSGWFQEEFFRFGRGIVDDLWSTKYSDMKLIQIPLPPVMEQRGIAALLDRETARIDALIEKKQRLIELLEEKRQAVITQAVTRGLDPNVPMRDSGAEWFPRIPTHWASPALGRVLLGIEQGRSPQCDSRPSESHEWGVLKSGCTNRGIFDSKQNKALTDDTLVEERFEVRRGDLLMSRASGSRDLIGSAAIVERSPSKLLLSDKTFRLHLAKRASPKFVAFALGSRVLRSQIEIAINGAEGLANNITQETIRRLRIALPPLEEQQMIVYQLERNLHQIGKLMKAVGRSKNLLRERRSALITAAVTGQIDIRDAAA